MHEYHYELTTNTKKFKEFTAKLVLWFLGRALEACTVLDENVKHEVEVFEEGSSILLKVQPSGPCIVMMKVNNKLKFMGTEEVSADLSIYFKNIEAANLALTGKKSIAQAYAEHRFMLKGNIALGMCLVRCICTVESYLFPKFMYKKLSKTDAKKTTTSFRIYTSTLFGIK